MRIRILILFVITQLFSFGLWSHFNAEANLPVPPLSETIRTTTPPSTLPAINPIQDQASQAPSVEPTRSSPSRDIVTSLSTAPSPFGHVHFSSRNPNSDTTERSTTILKNQVFKVFKKLPESHIAVIRNIILDFDPHAYRGMGGKRMIILRADMESKEFNGVLIHEIGHNVDLIKLRVEESATMSAFKDGSTPIYVGDPSLDFYRISWANETTLKKTAGNLDFVSGYAMTDPFEDFAETYAYYVLHHKDFKAKVATSTALFAKYRFMKYRVFNGLEFDTGNEMADTLVRPWDVTVLPYNLNEFLNNG